MIKFNVLNRFSGEIKFTAEIDCDETALPSLKLGLAVKWAIKEKADLRYANLSSANLSSADLSSADLSSANLRYANLSYADLSYADLRYANLSSADLSYANLRYANLSYADLSYADLRYANLSYADLSYADLRYANLSSADLSSADLSYADLRSFKADLWMTLAQNRHEVPALIAALTEGRVDGSTYEGPCACLVGTIANAKDVSYDEIEHSASNPAEVWFSMIRSGDKPGDDSAGGFAAKMALEWANDFQIAMASKYS